MQNQAIKYTLEEQAEIDRLMKQMEDDAALLKKVKDTRDKAAISTHLRKLRGTIVQLNTALDKNT